MTRPLVVLDFETYYDNEYSLSRMTTEEYLRDERFEVIGVAVNRDGTGTRWVSGKYVEPLLRSMNLSECAVCAHNAVFDASILSWHYNIHPAFLMDTLSMAAPDYARSIGRSLAVLARHYGLGAKGTEVINAKGKRIGDFTDSELMAYGAYCVQDVDLCLALLNRLVLRVPYAEMCVIDVVLRMFTRPLLTIDQRVLEHHLAAERRRRDSLLKSLGGGEAAAKILGSSAKLAKLLSLLGVEPPTKISPRTGKQTWAFAKTDLEFTALADSHPSRAVRTLVSARLGTKSSLEETRAKRLAAIGRRGALPVMLKYYGAHTGRLSGGDKVNLQNLTRGGKLRKAITAPSGFVIVAGDQSQIEARMTAYIAGQDDVVSAFANGEDVYAQLATDIYGRKITKAANPRERFVGKVGVLGLGFGMGRVRYAHTLRSGAMGKAIPVTDEEAAQVVNAYRKKNIRIVALWRKCARALSVMASGGSGEIHPLLPFDCEHIYLPNGMSIKYAFLTTDDEGTYRYAGNQRAYRAYESAHTDAARADVIRETFTKIYGGKVTENVVQALARISITGSLVSISKRYPVVLQIHDENVCLAPVDEKDEALAFVKREMTRPLAWAPGLPIDCEVGWGYTYAEAK